MAANWGRSRCVKPMDAEVYIWNINQFVQLLLQWRYKGHDSVSNHQPHHCLLSRFFSRRSKKTSKLRVTGLCAGNSPVTGEFPAQMASNAENVSIWWRHHDPVCRPRLVHGNTNKSITSIGTGPTWIMHHCKDLCKPWFKMCINLYLHISFPYLRSYYSNYRHEFTTQNIRT